MTAPRSGRARSGPRVQTLRQGRLPSSGVASTLEQWQSPGQSPHSSPRSRIESPPSRPSYPASISHRKTPARSYFHQSSYSPHGTIKLAFDSPKIVLILEDPIEIAQDNSHDVREDTAELASWALADRTPLSTGQSPSHISCSPASVTAQCHYEFKSLSTPDQDTLSQPESDHSTRHSVIHEVPEPASPGSLHSSRKSPGLSALSEMFRKTPPSDEETTDTEQDDQLEDSLGLRPVTVQEGIISQPHERTVLLLRKHAYGSNRADAYGSIQDIESQKVRNQNALHIIWETYRKVGNRSRSIARTAVHPKSWNCQAFWIYGVRQPLELFPPILLGLLLNILDALSYGKLRIMHISVFSFADGIEA